jgi:hypothetical protein
MKKKAEYQVSASVNDEILEIILTGEESDITSERMRKEIDNIIIASNIKNVLIDVRVLRGRLSISGTYERVRNHAPEINHVKLAVLDLPENAEYQKFHENTACNAGLSLKWFTDINAARTWLKNK